VYRSRALYNATSLSRATLRVTLIHANTVYHNFIFLRQGTEDIPGFTFVFSRYHFYFISFFDFHKNF